jgi:serine/threonine-protein kinase
VIDERWHRIKALFQAVAELPTEERDSYLDAATDIDDEMLRDVRSLLGADAPTESVFDRLPLIGAGVLHDVSARAVFAPGARVGPYEILALVGSGSMGDVYRARDTHLNRDVALKVLPETFALDADRLARFRREAQVLATLNHRNVAGIYGLEQSSGVTALVLEFVDGPTLAARMARAPLALDEVLPIARQIADALAAAHDKGVVHRDLKPANVAIGRDGIVKILDFGLAKISPTADESPTSSPQLTETDAHGRTVLGTPTYMSPEQACGRPLDRRTDLWSFGCVLYELLSGRPPFTGETVAETFAAVLEHDVDERALPADTPASIRRLLRRCLEKDPARRLDSATDARLEIDDARAESSAGLPRDARPTRSSRRMAIVALSGIVVALLSALFAWRRVWPASERPPEPARFAVVTPAEWPLNLSGRMHDIAFAPDGRTFAYRAGGSQTAGSGLMLRPIDRIEAAVLPSADYVYEPFFSPDGLWVAFFSRSALKKISVAGGPATTVCEFSGAPLGASWGDDNVIVFAVDGPMGGLWRVSGDGGTPVRLAAPDAVDAGSTYAFPSALPRGRGVLFTIQRPGPQGASQVALVDLKTGMRRVLIDAAADARYVDTGHLVFAAGGSLRNVRFDLDRLLVRDQPVAVAEEVLVKQRGAADYALTRDGTLLYVTAESGRPSPRSLVWVDRKGREEPLDVPQRQYGPLRISPDGKHVAIGIVENGSADLWTFDVTGGALRRLTFTPVTNGLPVWTPDGRQIVFSMYDQKGVLNLYRVAADGSSGYEPITSSSNPQWPTSITPDGTGVIGFDLEAHGPGGVTVVPFSSDPRAGRAIESLFGGSFAESSPNGRYLAYQSTESGRSEVYVRAFPDIHNGPWQISTAGGSRPVWRRDGRELFFLDAANGMTSVRVDTSGPTFVSEPPVRLFETGYLEPNPARHYDVSPDGQRFLMIKENSKRRDATPASMVVVQNWTSELRLRLPTR